MENNKQKEWTEYMRWITPILVTLCLFLLANINHKVDLIDDKLFKHLTNDEMHSPRSLFVSRAEFSIYQEFRTNQMEDLTVGMKDIKEMLREHSRETAGKH